MLKIWEKIINNSETDKDKRVQTEFLSPVHCLFRIIRILICEMVEKNMIELADPGKYSKEDQFNMISRFFRGRIKDMKEKLESWVKDQINDCFNLIKSVLKTNTQENKLFFNSFVPKLEKILMTRTKDELKKFSYNSKRITHYFRAPNKKKKKDLISTSLEIIANMERFEQQKVSSRW